MLERFSFNSRATILACALGGIAIVALLSSCSSGDSGGSQQQASSRPIEPYCAYIASPRTFSPAITIAGKAVYEFRDQGNGPVSDSVHTLTPATASNGQIYSLVINGRTESWACAQSSCTPSSAVAGLIGVINADSSLNISVSGSSTLIIAPKIEGDALSVSSLTLLTDSANKDPNPIRYAEVRLTRADGSLIQCTETDGAGGFSLSAPANAGALTVSVASRASNAHNSAFVLTNPSENTFYQVSSKVGTGSSTSSVRLIARATGSLEGGAFNILDQINNAQSFLRSTTANCNIGGAVNYFPDCEPVTTVPMIHAFWTPGLTPGVYVGVSGPISYYLMGKSELYILGGLNGDTELTDMDHYDNSVIIHEYGHFIEDQFAMPNSPGGSHDGNSIIDPRLAWGEGWADFFQAAVTGNPVYRDTYGHVGCTTPPGASQPCTGVNFNENLDPSPGDIYSDKPASGAVGEGNFREFSITRVLWQITKPGSSVTNSGFPEIWAALHGSTRGMKAVADQYKYSGRMWAIQASDSALNSNHPDWSTVIANEEQIAGSGVYATSLSLASGCAPTTKAMNIYKSVFDSGSFATSDQYRNNAFFLYNHTGGPLNVHLNWSGSSVADLDLYVYKPKYIFGDYQNSSIGYDAAQSDGTSGSANVSVNAPPGSYMINVMAYTGLYQSTGTYTTNYSLTINGVTACPQ